MLYFNKSQPNQTCCDWFNNSSKLACPWPNWSILPKNFIWHLANVSGRTAHQLPGPPCLPPSPLSLNTVGVYACVHKLCVHMCLRSSVYPHFIQYGFVGSFLIRAHPVSTGLWCYTWIYAGGMCLDFWVWSSTSCSGSHVLNVDASDVRLSSRFLIYIFFFLVRFMYSRSYISSKT